MLAGGRGSRLGGDKAGADVAGRPLLAWTIDAVRPVAEEVVVVAKKHSPLPECRVPVWRESAADFHPRHGLVRALSGARGRPLVVVPVDMPLVPAALLSVLLDAVEGGAPAAMPRADGRLHPLCAAFAPSALRALESAPPDEPLTRTLEDLGAEIVEAGAVADRLLNVNTPDELREAERRLAPDHGRHSYTASLRIFSETRTLAELVDLLGAPAGGHSAGDPVSRRGAGVFRTSLWSLGSSLPGERPLEEHLEQLVTFAEAHRVQLEALRGDCEIDLFCGVFAGAQGGFELPPELLRRLTALDLKVGVALYGAP